MGGCDRLDLIEREIQVSTPDRPGLIMAKVNSLEDRGICDALGISRVLSGWLRSRQGQAQTDRRQADSDESSGGSIRNSASSIRVVSTSSEGMV